MVDFFLSLNGVAGEIIPPVINTTDAIVFTFRGQSNALGRADASLLSIQDSAEQEDIYIFESPNIVKKYKAGEFSMNVGQYGVELFLSQKLRDYHNRPVYIDKYAVGGTTLASNTWENGNWNLNSGDTQLWAKSKVFHTDAQFYKKLQYLQGLSKVLIWVQGESDSEYLDYSNSYYSNETALFNDWRAFKGDPNFKIIDALTYSEPLYASIVRAAKTQIATDLGNITNIDITGFSRQDTVHLNESGMRQFADAIFNEIKDYWAF